MRNSPWIPALIVFAVAFLLRLIYVLQAQANPQFDAPLMDPGYHDEWAWSLASGSWEPSGPFFRAPLYPLFLGAIYAVLGHDFLAVRIVQALLGSISCVLVFLIGARLFSRTVGWIAGLGAVAYWILIYFDSELLIPVLLVPLTLGFFYTLVRLLEGCLWELPGDALRRTAARSRAGPQPHTVSRPPAGVRPLPWASLSGALYGLAAIARPSVLVFLPVLVWVFVRARRRGLPWIAVGAFALLAAVPIGVVTVYNATTGGDLVFVASQGGVNFYIGNNPQSDGHTAIVPGTRPDWWGGRHDTIKIAERAVGRALKESEVSRYWFRQGLHFVTSQPGAWLALTLRKLALFWSAPEIGNNSSIYHQRAYAPVMKLPLLGFGLVTPLALAGVYLVWRRRGQLSEGRPAAGRPIEGRPIEARPAAARPVETRPNGTTPAVDLRRRALLPLLFILFYMAGVVVFFVCARYRVPVIPFLLLFAAHAIHESARLWRGGQRRPVLTAAVLFLLAAVAVNLPSRAHQENLGLARFHDGVAWKTKGNMVEAERAFRDALRLDPGLDAARSNLANLLAARGAGEEVRLEYERALASNPQNVKTLANLASYYLDNGNLAEAESTLVRALALDPDFSPALRILGVIHERQGDLASAREAYTHALRFAEEPHRLENNLGVVAMKEGNPMVAEAHLRRSLELEPTYALAWGNLGVLLAQTGRLDLAADALQRAASLEPDSPTHWTQLAEILRQLGRLPEARAAERRAQALQHAVHP